MRHRKAGRRTACTHSPRAGNPQPVICLPSGLPHPAKKTLPSTGKPFRPWFRLPGAAGNRAASDRQPAAAVRSLVWAISSLSRTVCRFQPHPNSKQRDRPPREHRLPAPVCQRRRLHQPSRSADEQQGRTWAVTSPRPKRAPQSPDRAAARTGHGRRSRNTGHPDADGRSGRQEPAGTASGQPGRAR